jgi:predicted Zn-dependent peptidase
MKQLDNRLKKYFKTQSFNTDLPDHEIVSLENGMKLVYKQVPFSQISHCGIMINSGSKNDMDNPGLAHFVEHMIFKGTKNRKGVHILNRIESIGGELNAFTDRQVTCLYTSAMNEYTERSVELLSDMFQNSVFPAREIPKERNVILDEISMYQDNPEETIYDEFYSMSFGDHPYGNPVLGTTESVNAIGKTELETFYKRYYQPENAVFSYVGSLPIKKVKQWVEKHVKADINPISVQEEEYQNSLNTFEKRIKSDHVQSYAVMGFPAYSYSHKKRAVLSFITNLLGGPAMNSRLSLNIREKYGFAYQLEANYSAYKSGGLFSCFVSTHPKQMKRCLKLIENELNKLKNKSMGTKQLSLAKKQFIGQILMAEENNAGLMSGLGKEFVLYNKITTTDQLLLDIDSISREDVLEVSNEIFNNNLRSILVYS